MSSQRDARHERRAAHLDPENYTCGQCKQVQVFDAEAPYECSNCQYNVVEQAVEETPEVGA